MLDQIRSFLHQHAMLRPDTLVLVGVSGGADSVCLLHALRALAGEFRVGLHVAHLDHQLRGADSEGDAAFVAELAAAWGLPATIASREVARYAQQHRLNLHEAARVVRYRFFAETALALGAASVAVAHHANDQAETVLLHLLRGAGTTGLRGIRPLVPWREWAAPLPADAGGGAPLVRPLLGQGRGAINDYCAAHGLGTRLDQSNHDTRHTRNRIRAELLPLLIEYNPHVVAALGRTAEICADDADFIAAALDRAWPQLARERPGGIDFDGAAWRASHPAMQRAALRRAFAQLGGGETLSREHVERARALADGAVGKRIELPGGVLLHVGYGGALSLGAPPPADGPQLSAAETPLAVPGRTELDGGWAIICQEGGPPPARPASRWEVYLDADTLDGPLLARQRRPGDRVRLAVGHRRVQDLLVDAKVARALRPRWPIIATAHEVVWAVGVRVAAPFAATEATRRSIRIQIVPGYEQHLITGGDT